MKIGDIIRNGYAGDKNPHKLGVFIGMSSVAIGPYSHQQAIILLHSDGTKTPYCFGKKDKPFYTVVGHVDFIDTLKKLEQSDAPANNVELANKNG